MSDSRQSSPPPKSNGALYFIVGGLVVAVGVVAYVISGGSPRTTADGTGSGSSDITIENNAAPEPAPTALPQTTEPSSTAPATKAPADP